MVFSFGSEEFCRQGLNPELIIIVLLPELSFNQRKALIQDVHLERGGVVVFQQIVPVFNETLDEFIFEPSADVGGQLSPMNGE